MTVKQQQCLLAYLGYEVGAIDGENGKNTIAATIAFQMAEDLVPDGKCGPITEAALLDAVQCGRFAVIKTANIPESGTFWDTVEFFTEEEFNCKCGGKYCNGKPSEMCETVVRIADAARKHFGRAGHVVSGLRDVIWNKHEGGVDGSQHCDGEAIDLRIDGVGSAELQQFVSRQPGHRYSYCINGSNVHFDVPRGSK